MIQTRPIRSDRVYLLVCPLPRILLSWCFGADGLALKVEETGAQKKKSKK
jgi:hypothetical protein